MESGSGRGVSRRRCLGGNGSAGASSRRGRGERRHPGQGHPQPPRRAQLGCAGSGRRPGPHWGGRAGPAGNRQTPHMAGKAEGGLTYTKIVYSTVDKSVLARALPQLGLRWGYCLHAVRPWNQGFSQPRQTLVPRPRLSGSVGFTWVRNGRTGGLQLHGAHRHIVPRVIWSSTRDPLHLCVANGMAFYTEVLWRRPWIHNL